MDLYNSFKQRYHQSLSYSKTFLNCIYLNTSCNTYLLSPWAVLSFIIICNFFTFFYVFESKKTEVCASCNVYSLHPGIGMSVVIVHQAAERTIFSRGVNALKPQIKIEKMEKNITFYAPDSLSHCFLVYIRNSTEISSH